MSVILQHGDKILLALPYGSNSGFTQQEHRKAAEKEAAELTKFFAEHGVTVLRWCANSALTHPKVVAVLPRETFATGVFREP